MSAINSTGPEELSLLANTFAIALARDKDTDEINILGTFLSSVGDLLQLIAAQKENLQNQQDKNQQIKDLKKQIKDLKN